MTFCRYRTREQYSDSQDQAGAEGRFRPAAFCADGEGQRIPVRRSCRQRRKWKKQQTPSFAAYVGPEAGTLSPDRMDGGAIPISPLQRAAGRFSAAPLRNIVLGTAVLIFLALLIVAWSRGWLNRSFVRASTVNRPVRGSAASRQPLWGPGARLLRRRHDG